MYINTNMYFYISSPENIYKADRLYPGKHLMMKFWTSLQDINHLLIIYISIKVQRSSVQKLSAIIYIFHIIFARNSFHKIYDKNKKSNKNGLIFIMAAAGGESFIVCGQGYAEF